MSAPKHLWSGDWESESRRPAVIPLPAHEEEAEAQPAAAPPQRTGFSRRQIAVALGAGLAAAAATVALALTLGGTHKPGPRARHHTSASTSSPGVSAQPKGSGGGGLNSKPSANCAQGSASCTGTTVTQIVNGPSADWMGMQIVTSPGGVVVSTVRLGSAADVAGFEPGDQIESVDGHLIGSVTELRSDTAAVHVGGPVTVDVMRSSVQLSLASVHMTQRPTIHP